MALSGADKKPDRPTLNEIEVTSRARQALLADARLKPLNLFVTVQQGVAIVRGPVPSNELGQRAVQVLEQVRGVYEVRNQLSLVMAPTEAQIFIPLQNEEPTRTQSASPDPRSGALTKLAGRSAQSPPAVEKKKTPSEQAPNPFPASNDTQSTGVTLLPPVKLPDGTWVSPQPQPGADPVATLQGQVEQLRVWERRFRSLQTEVRDAQTIWVHDDPWRGDDIAGFVEGLRKLPGVRSVVIKSPSSPAPR